MLPDQARLKRAQDFERVRLQGRTWRGTLFKLNAAPNGLALSRFGLVVSRRVGNTVQRNRVKRRLRAALFSYLPQLIPGFDVIVIASPDAARVTYSAMHASLSMLLQLAGLVKVSVPE